jgi:Kdo2-lipid IVA lauroyltransferase/acyltransferase
MLTRIGIFLLWLLHFLPFPAIAAIGQVLGALVYVTGQGRTARINLSLCFPHLSEAERRRIARHHFRALGQSALALGILWWGSKERIQKWVKVENIDYALPYAQRKQPLICFTPHFVGLDFGGVRLSTEYHGAAVYSRQKNAFLDRLLKHARTRFGLTEVFARQDSLRPALRALKGGTPLYLLPDGDFGAEESIFVPFFNVPAATVPVLARFAKISGAAVVPCVTEQLPAARGYVVRFYPAWENFPSGDVAVDTRRMNAFIEERALEMPAQYFWIHKRFRTRPPGTPNPYAWRVGK